MSAHERSHAYSIQVLDFGAFRDGVPEAKRGKRTVVDLEGRELHESAAPRDNAIDVDGADD